MIHLPNGVEALILGIAGGLTAAMISGLGVTLGTTALVSLTAIIFKEIGIRLIRKYDAYIIHKRKKRNYE